MANLNGFDANQVEPASDFDVIPAGKYLAIITESEMKPTKTGNGNYLQLSFQILEGECKGRRVWARLNLDHPNPTTVQIAQGELSALCRALGVMKPTDSCELHNRPVVIHVKQRKRADNGEFQNEIRGYSSKETSSTSSAAKPPVLSTNGTSTNPPWKR